MNHRHLDYPPRTPVERMPAAAIVDLLDRGDLDDWRPVAAAIRRRPFGPFAERVRRLVDAYPMYGTSPLWRAWIDRCRLRSESRVPSEALDLAAVRRGAGLTQAVVADRMGMSQSDLSKLERRKDVRVSSLRAYAQALGGRLEVLFASVGERTRLRVGRTPGRRART